MVVLQVVGQAAGGVLRHLHQLVSGLEDHRFILAGPAASVEGFRDLPEVVAVWRLPLGAGPGPVGEWVARRRLRSELARLDAWSIDLVHVHGWRAGVTVLREVQDNVPVVWTAHTQPPRDTLARWLIGQVLNRQRSFPIQLIAVSDSLAAEVGRTWPRSAARVWTVRNGLSSTVLDTLGRLPRSGRDRVRQYWAQRGAGGLPESGAWDPPRPGGSDHAAPVVELPFPAPVLGFMGRIWGPKGIFDAIEALAVLVQAGWPAVLEVAGDGPHEAAARRLARERGMGARVAFLGWQEPSEFLARIDLLLHPSRSEGGVPYTVMEAMAAGVPVVAARLPPLEEVRTIGTPPARPGFDGSPVARTRAPEDGDLLALARPGDPADLARVTAACLNDPEATARRAEAASRFARVHLGLDTTLERTRHVYRSAVAHARVEGEVLPTWHHPEPGLAGCQAGGYNLSQTRSMREDGDEYPS